MADLLGLLSLLAPFFGMIGLGIVSARLARLPASGLAWMQFFLVNLALPCLFFRLLADKPIAEIANGRFVALTTLCTAIAFAMSFFVTRPSAGLPARVIGAVSGSYSNIGYMGPPLVTSFLGPAASAPVALIFVFDTIFLFTAVPALMALAGVEHRSAWTIALQIVRRVALHPFMLATAAGVLASLAHWRPPEAADRVIGWLAGASAPCALFTLGVTVALQPVGRIAGTVSALVAIKLVAHPLIVWVMLSAFADPDPTWIQAALVMAALSPALNIFVLATQYRAGVERASACVLVGTVCSMGTLTLLLWLLKTGAVPPILFRG